MDADRGHHHRVESERMNHLRPADFKRLWPSIRERAMPRLQEEPGGVAGLMREIAEGRSTCWVNGEGVVVLSLVQAPDGQDLFVRAAVTFKPTLHAVDHLMPDLRKIAMDLGANAIRFRSQRAGWIRALGPDWRIAHIEYVTGAA